jgi:DNA repair protein RecO (recombination protein O)
MRVSLQPSYVLHSRPYRDSSALLEVFTAEYGRISLVARGARRRSRGGSSSALLQPFIPLLLSFSGRTELKTLTATEAVGKVLMLRGERMFSGLYVNELLVRLLHQHDAHPQLFATYAGTLQTLAGNEVVDTVLRHFEFTLLHELGYSFDLDVDGSSGAAVREDLWYHYQPDFGMVARGDTIDRSRPAFTGSELLTMAGGEFGGPVRLSAKRLLRQVLATHLGDTPLRSRDLFRAGSAARSPLARQVESVTGDKP